MPDIDPLYDEHRRKRIEFDHVVQHGESAEAKAANVLYRFMCCEAGRNLVEYGILQPFGYTMTKREVDHAG